MPYYHIYNQLIAFQSRIPKSKLVPKNVYRIVRYKYADGNVGSFTGTKSTLIFLIGITPDKKLNCLKISEVKPFIFFRWLNSCKKPTITDDYIDELINMNELFGKTDKGGRQLFNSSIKNRPIYKRPEHIYRTYNLTGISEIYEVDFKKDVFKQYLT
jgi:hypothetical protein